MKPKPFWVLKNFTVPVGILRSSRLLRLSTRRALIARQTKHPSFWEMSCGAQKTGA
jgi:hypothetical protein